MTSTRKTKVADELESGDMFCYSTDREADEHNANVKRGYGSYNAYMLIYTFYDTTSALRLLSTYVQRVSTVVSVRRTRDEDSENLIEILTAEHGFQYAYASDLIEIVSDATW